MKNYGPFSSWYPRPENREFMSEQKIFVKIKNKLVFLEGVGGDQCQAIPRLNVQENEVS